MMFEDYPRSDPPSPYEEDDYLLELSARGVEPHWCPRCDSLLDDGECPFCLRAAENLTPLDQAIRHYGVDYR